MKFCHICGNRLDDIDLICIKCNSKQHEFTRPNGIRVIPKEIIIEEPKKEEIVKEEVKNKPIKEEKVVIKEESTKIENNSPKKSKKGIIIASSLVAGLLVVATTVSVIVITSKNKNPGEDNPIINNGNNTNNQIKDDYSKFAPIKNEAKSFSLGTYYNQNNIVTFNADNTVTKYIIINDNGVHKVVYKEYGTYTKKDDVGLQCTFTDYSGYTYSYLENANLTNPSSGKAKYSKSEWYYIEGTEKLENYGEYMIKVPSGFNINDSTTEVSLDIPSGGYSFTPGNYKASGEETINSFNEDHTYRSYMIVNDNGTKKLSGQTLGYWFKDGNRISVIKTSSIYPFAGSLSTTTYDIYEIQSFVVSNNNTLGEDSYKLTLNNSVSIPTIWKY